MSSSRELLEFWDELPRLERRFPALAGFFEPADEVLLARAPGRLDVMGGIADYSGALVLEQPIREAARVAVARTSDERVRVASVGSELRDVTLSAADLRAASSSFEEARQFFRALSAQERFCAYVLGGLAVLQHELGAELSGGVRLLLDSRVPEGKGVSSSAAIEVASLRALAEAFGVTLDGPQLALACQRVENLVVGAPCGVMDQMTCACGRENRLLLLSCQPAEIRGFVAWPEGATVFGIDSGLRHAVTGADYGQVRAGAFMGLRMLAERLGARAQPVAPGRVLLEGDPLGGYLANLGTTPHAGELLATLPEQLSGAEFLRRFGGISDAVTTVQPDVSYRVRAAAAHPVYEHTRVQRFAELLPGASSDDELSELGELMFQAHSSYSACGLGSAGTDRLVELVREAGPSQGLFGAKITGGGSGGTVAVLARPNAAASIDELSARYARETGRAAHVFAGSSPGAVYEPVLRRRW